MRCTTLTIRVGKMPWPQRDAPCTVMTSRQRSCNQRVVVCWLWPNIYELGLWTSARCVGLVPCCVQDGYQAQAPQHLIDTCRYKKKYKYWLSTICKCPFVANIIRENYLNFAIYIIYAFYQSNTFFCLFV